MNAVKTRKERNKYGDQGTWLVYIDGFFEDEPGADIVRSLIFKSEEDSVDLRMRIVNLREQRIQSIGRWNKDFMDIKRAA